MNTFYLSSEEALNTGFIFDSVSKPVYTYRKSTFLNERVYIVEIPEWKHYERHYEYMSEDEKIGVWVRSCNGGFIDVQEVTLDMIVKKGIFSVIEFVTGLTTETNRALAIAEITRHLGYQNPKELFNAINEKLNEDLHN